MRPLEIHRRQFMASSLGLAAWLAAPRLALAARPEKGRLSLAVGGRATLYHLPLTIADQLGYFAEEGLEVEILEHADSTHAMQQAVAGRADVCAGAFEQLIVLHQQHKMFQSLVQHGRTPQVAVGVSRRTMAGYSGLGSLRGRKIGVTAQAVSSGTVARLLMSRAGLAYAPSQFVDAGSGEQAMAAVRSGALDALSHTEPVMTMLEQQGDVQIIADTRTLKGTQELFGGLMPGACLYTSDAFVQRYPRTCQALADAIVHSLKWLQTAGPGDLVKTVPENHLMGDRATYLASFQKMREALSPDGVMPDDSGVTALRALSALNPTLRADRIDIGRLHTNVFARRAKDKYKA